MAQDARTTHVALLTPPGRGGIGVVRLWGTGAEAVLRAVFKTRSPHAFRPGRLAYGWIEDREGPVDEVIVHTPPENAHPFAVFDINCHGGIVSVHKVKALLRSRGVAEASWEDFLDLAAPDAVRAEAGKAAVRAHTEFAASVLLAQYAGALSDALNRTAERMERKQAGDAASEVAALLATWPLGKAVSRPSLTCLAGAPNTGKSSLLNLLLGEDRAIVSPVSGTTRDAVGETADILGFPVALTDLAGLGHREDEIHRLASEKALAYLAKTDLVLLVFDASRPLTDMDREAIAAAQGRAALAVVNKSDLPEVTAPDDIRTLTRLDPIRVSALTGDGLEALQNAVAEALCPPPRPDPLGPVVFTERQRGLLSECAACLDRGAPARAAEAVRQILQGPG